MIYAFFLTSFFSQFEGYPLPSTKLGSSSVVLLMISTYIDQFEISQINSK
jgi:hypothetical protein